ncbi:hypothetical protein [Flavobacterium geliluteum]|uniref:Uncharacterized protein n=1 Tax=Flavobacterium geliluteum TaxID=2816120 RepID=A0A941B0D7_9FLAO|nr:hypothetical protein [Flavobacterium geliluteum]MBP4140052.1 hypothetical protein [Flavobacterium geliluteum]
MLNKFLENYNKLSFEKEEELNTIFFVMFYGGEKELKSKLNELKKQLKTDEEIFEILKIETNFSFWVKVSEIMVLNNISALIETKSKLQESRDELLSLITDHEGLKKMLTIQKPFAEYYLKTLFGIDLEDKTREESKILLKKIIYVTKETIAVEFKCNKRTLTKWLEFYFGDRFVRKDRKITIDEYIEIFEAFFLSDEKLHLNNDLNKYLKRLQKGVTFNKSDLALLCDSDLKTQRENLKKIAIFSCLNKYPYSICKDLASRMGYELEF